ncbi:MAG: AAA family ATPase, partial [Lachnospiraceae bacterium]|nr:AAA family ATPase [Lachnospiraceae bacterium]
SDMDKFLEANQGLASRLSREIVFEDYTVDELVSIFISMVGNEGLILDGNISEEMISSVIEDKKEAVKDFANARGVRNLVDDVKRKMNTRLVPLIRSGEEIADEELITVKKEDL